MTLNIWVPILAGISVLVLATIFGIIAYFIKRYVDNQDTSIKELKLQNEKLLIRIGEETETLKETFEKKIVKENRQTNSVLIKEKEVLLKQIEERDKYIAKRVERRVRRRDCICSSEEVRTRFDAGDRLFKEIKNCLDNLNSQVGDGLEGVHQYSLIMSSTMLALCRNFGENVDCKELETLHTLLQKRKIEHIVEKVEQ